MSEAPKLPEPPSSEAGKARRPDLEALLGDGEPAGADESEITLERIEAELLVEPAANGGAGPDGGGGGTLGRGGLPRGGAAGRAPGQPGGGGGGTPPRRRASAP